MESDARHDAPPSDVELTHTPASPCIRHCCLDLYDVCVGCGRHINEITSWQRSSDDEKRAILARCQQRLQQRSPTSSL
jgi:predicted Fe-S protein YdhL (DUF1289 family)